MHIEPEHKKRVEVTYSVGSPPEWTHRDEKTYLLVEYEDHLLSTAARWLRISRPLTFLTLLSAAVNTINLAYEKVVNPTHLLTLIVLVVATCIANIWVTAKSSKYVDQAGLDDWATEKFATFYFDEIKQDELADFLDHQTGDSLFFEIMDMDSGRAQQILKKKIKKHKEEKIVNE